MNQSRSDQGQSMEDILASIRRIIAEGEHELPGHDPLRAVVVEPKPTVDTRPPWSRPEPSAPSELATDVLVLTEMVQDDGTVVSFELEASAPSVETTGTGATMAPPELAVDLRRPSAIEVRESRPEIAHETAHVTTPPLGASPEEVLKSIAAGLAVEKVEAKAEAAAPPTVTERQTAIAPSYPPVEQTEGSVELQAAPAAVSATPPLEMEKHSVSGEGLKKPELVSEETLAASTAALAQLAQSVGRTREVPPGQSQTVEELVRGALEPMLKQWLDANLSRIVERMVREAIDRVVRRVE